MAVYVLQTIHVIKAPYLIDMKKLKIGFVLLCIIYFVFTSCLKIEHVNGLSMYPTFTDGQYIIGIKYFKPKRYDVVVFKYPLDDKQYWIKRIIGLPNEHIEIRNGKVFVNYSKTPLEEPYLPSDYCDSYEDMVFDVPNNYYFVLADNRSDASDSRFWRKQAIDYGFDDKDIYSYVPSDYIVEKIMYYEKN